METPEDLFEQTENSLNKGASWGIVYGDFMSYLMVFFLVLFSFALDAQREEPAGLDEGLDGIQKEFGGKMTQEQLDRLTRRQEKTRLSEELNTIVTRENLARFASIINDKDRVRLILTSPVLFDSGKAELKPEAVKTLAEVAGALKKVRGEIMVEGHTDNVPIHDRQFASNWDLSVSRANTVVKVLIGAGIEPARLTAAGYGEYRPREPNDDETRQAMNRRIEVCLMKEQRGGV